MTVTHQFRDGNNIPINHWGSERTVEVPKMPNSNLGLSIVSGKVEVVDAYGGTADDIHGIFIRHVEADSPAGNTGRLKIGDHILEINGINVRNSTYDQAVELIKNAGNSIRFVVQSFILSQEPLTNSTNIKTSLDTHYTPMATDPVALNVERTSSDTQKVDEPLQLERSESPEKIHSDENTEMLRKSKSQEDTSDESSDSEDERHMEGNIRTKAGMEISRRSAGNIKRSTAEIAADPENEDEYGYTLQKIKKKYGHLGAEVLFITLSRVGRDIGLALAGHKDRMQMGVFICGINLKDIVCKGGTVKEGDEILEVNGYVFQNRCHLNASSIIKKMPAAVLKIIIYRRTSNDNLAVKAVNHFPTVLDEKDQYSQFDDVRTIAIQKGHHGLGIMIVEGKHGNVGRGIFASDIQEGSVAEKAGLQVGDMILGVNSDTLLGSSYDDATNLLKGTEGLVILTVCNPNKNKKSPSTTNTDGKISGGSPSNTMQKPTATDSKMKTPADSKPQTAPTESCAPGKNEKSSEVTKPDVESDKAVPAKPTTTELQISKDNGVKFTIIGGSNTPSMGVFVNDVFFDNNAAMSVVIQSGDQILDFGQENFRNIDSQTAQASILSVSGNIKMIFLRDEKAIEEFEVELQKKVGKGFGLGITEFKNGKGVYISEMFDAGSALESGKLSIGDRIISICGQDVREMPAEDIAVLMKVSNSILLKLTRYKTK